jgi:16S rRNA G966 N2-methylase RsmD
VFKLRRKAVLRVAKGRGFRPKFSMITSIDEGDLILDNCAGSGTTAIAAMNLNRDYILIEKEAEYIEVIKKRITKHTPPDFSNLGEIKVEESGQLSLF